MDEELAPANQRIDDMSFKDLTARAAAALKLKPAKISSEENETKPTSEEAPAKRETS